MLEQGGFTVDASPLEPGRFISRFSANLPAMVLIDLDRLPSHGREVAIALRNSKTTRHIPIVFAGGAEEKVERIRSELPDALFTDWKNVTRALKKAMKGAPVQPVQPTPHMQRWASSSLVHKLGFKTGMNVAFLGAPEGFEEMLGDLPQGVEIEDKISRRTELTIWFVRSRHELESETEYASARLRDRCSLWIIHPKQTGRYRVDFNQRDVRAVALAAGLVDYKVCAVDADWSGMKFTRKKV
jgi:CheY-like chemotaxis protein